MSKQDVSQFNLFHRIIYTNRLLCKTNLVDSDLCTFCEEEVESLEHLFFRCKISQDFWNAVFLWLSELHFEIDALNEIDTMLGYTSRSQFWTLLNHVIITGKQVIYHNRQRKTTSLLCHLIAKLKYIERIEKHIALNNRLDFHGEKWQPLLDM